jgi:hypothetical protein
MANKNTTQNTSFDKGLKTRAAGQVMAPAHARGGTHATSFMLRKCLDAYVDERGQASFRNNAHFIFSVHTARQKKEGWTGKKDRIPKPAFGVFILCWSPKIRESGKLS